ncbi:hypothetical protein CEUSTIGMA_g2087.t1 [Chlamydomonas eustigma]|uniref:CCHC-type domain-containing protein n=1 Tax=Chlamydomonas eustigma TaxID=1157962 RepID=A0A250WVA5_9CHLO|nr:hypothetical protein CEUSTIGMA_g2087.t1 [Chlamydomonas eustigma]|eukprot:GAX74639.1 hypothetical protein CEUSTIGMA_g2087.t1 [Chlamydomonas eustigma]
MVDISDEEDFVVIASDEYDDRADDTGDVDREQPSKASTQDDECDKFIDNIHKDGEEEDGNKDDVDNGQSLEINLQLAQSKKKKKKKKKIKSTDAAAGMDNTKEIADKSLTTTDVPEGKVPSRATIPAGVILVGDSREIERDMEMTRLIRQPRYFDDVTLDVNLSGRCFNCGKVGHRVSECTFAAREKPCYLCAQFGHEARACPAELCFRCGRPGHKSRDCPNSSKVSSWEMGVGRCLRCASSSCACANKADYFRYEGGCTEDFLASDVSKCKCYVCGRYGHICCTKTPSLPARVSCFSCGSAKHLGEACPSEFRAHLAAERSGDMRAAQREREAEIERGNAAAAASRVVGRQHGGGQHWGRGRYSDQYDGRQQQQYPDHSRRDGEGAGHACSYPGSVDRDSHKRQRIVHSDGRMSHQGSWGRANGSSHHSQHEVPLAEGQHFRRPSSQHLVQRWQQGVSLDTNYDTSSPAGMLGYGEDTHHTRQNRGTQQHQRSGVSSVGHYHRQNLPEVSNMGIKGGPDRHEVSSFGHLPFYSPGRGSRNPYL